MEIKMRKFFVTCGSVCKQTLRTVRTFRGRYLALMLIVAISVGFLAGLKICTEAMVNTGDIYLEEQSFYDYRFLSTVGFDKGAEEDFLALDSVEDAEGTNTVDALVTLDIGDKPMKLYALTERVNVVKLISGRLPEAAGECVVDAERFADEDIGTKIVVSEENDAATLASLNGTEYTIVGLVDSPMYLGIDRGTTGIGSGSIYSFAYIPCENFTADYYTEISVTLAEDAYIYSDEYDELIEKAREEIAAVALAAATARRDGIFAELYEQYKAAFGIEITLEMAEANGLPALELYTLTRRENAGYLSFENDTSIISGVANIFPIFFIVIALLVCITTMTRMVDEERTQIGVLKAMGYSRGAIMAKYLLYAGTATVLGWVLGFFLCTRALPQIFWAAYAVLYGFREMPYVFSLPLALITLAVALAAILGATYISARRELAAKPAELIRPRAAKSGKRILLERITPLWKRFSFIQKIILRNMFRYKRRFVMMLVGISCCAGLVVTAFGVRDSMVGIADKQFGRIQKYELEVTFDEGALDTVSERLDSTEGVTDYIPAYSTYVDAVADEGMNSLNLLVFRDTGRVEDFWSYTDGAENLGFPEDGEVFINDKIADNIGVAVGDEITLRTSDMQTLTARVGGIFENHVYNYVIASEATYESALGEWRSNSVLVKTTAETGDEVGKIAERLTDIDAISTVSNIASSRETVSSALGVLDYIIWLVIFFSGALAFIVIFNLTNINIAERSREIATVEVLGFYPRETNSYVLRENVILSVIAGVIGMPLGVLFHRAVMSMVIIDMFTFDLRIAPVSYLISFLLTIAFALIVNLFMHRQIGKIQMAESLKAVE